MATVVREGKYSIDDHPDGEMKLEFQTASEYFTITDDGRKLVLSIDAMSCLLRLLKQMDHRIEVMGILPKDGNPD